MGIFDLGDLKTVAIIVASGVVTAIAVQLVTGYLEQKAVLASRAELQKLMLAAAASAQPTQQTTPPSYPSQTSIV